MIVDRLQVQFKPCNENAMLGVANGLVPLVRQGSLRRLTLSGSLGAGKTSFARGLLQGLGITGRIRSPSFAVAERYDLPGLVIHHIDLYRLEDPHAWRSAGLRETLSEGLAILEWPERAAGLPDPDLAISIDWADRANPEGPRLLLATTASQDIHDAVDALARNLTGLEA
jgi:tRNA threonylcarbamoyl adenosine modification protein YjeE